MGVPAIRPQASALGVRAAVPRAAVLFAGLVVGLAAALRMAGLTDRALWFDETISVFFAQQSVARLLSLLPANDPHPPLHYLLLHLWIGWLGDGEAAVRGLSVLISVPVVLATWLFGRRVIGAWPALFAAAIVAVAPSQVAAGQEARMYGLLTLTALASWWALWHAVDPDDAPGQVGGPGGLGAWAAYAVATAVMLYTHYYGFFVVASQAAFLLWRGLSSTAWRRAVLAGLGVLLLFFPWLPSFLVQVGAGRGWPAHRPPLTMAALPDALVAMSVGQPIFSAGAPPEYQVPGTALMGLVGFAAAVVLSVYALRGKALTPGRRALLVSATLGPLLLAFVVSLSINVFARRYLLLITPPAALLMAAGAAALAAHEARWRRAAALGLAMMVLLPNVAGTVTFARQPRLDTFDWRLVARTLAAKASDADAIVLLPGFSRIPLDYYYRGPQPRLALTPDGADVIAENGGRLPEVTRQLAAHRRVWVLTAPPVPVAVDSLAAALAAQGYVVSRLEPINAATLILLERTGAP
jgi:uncharacterized membrane protein